MPRKKYTTEQRLDAFWQKVDKNGPIPSPRPDLDPLLLPPNIDLSQPCWLWTAGCSNNGYGVFALSHRQSVSAHRLVYELTIGPIPKPQIDHLCRVHRCVNPAHLEPVTGRVNTLRGESMAAKNAQKTHCPRGHAFDEINTYHYDGSRYCRICDRAKLNARRRKRRQASHPPTLA